MSDTKRPATLDEASALQSTVLEDLSSARNYTAWIAALTGRWLGDNPIEIGSGHGETAPHWVGDGRTVTVSEADPARLRVLRERYDDHDAITVRELRVPIRESAAYSAAVALNVLEHIEDDVEALRDFARLLRPGGRVVLVVPAFEFAMSRFDREIGHYRRYRLSTMEAALRAAGLRPLELRYVNAVGLVGWTLVVKLLRGRPREGALLQVFDRVFVPLLRRVEGRIRPPFGQSVLAVAEKPAS